MAKAGRPRKDASKTKPAVPEAPQGPTEGSEKETALIPFETQGGQIVRPVVSTEQAVATWRAFQELKKRLLDGSDYQVIYINERKGGSFVRTKKPFVKKSGWRKLATAFNLSDEVVKEERKEYNVGTANYYFVYEVSAKAIAPNGRYVIGLGSCASNERQFAHLDHDVRSTASTRAKNRAISDLIGGGEVSAEEVDIVQEAQEIKQEIKQENCTVDHSTLPIKKSQKANKNKDREYIVCPTCGFWRWYDIYLKDKEEKEKEQPISTS